MLKNECNFPKRKKKIEKKPCVSEIIAPEGVVRISLLKRECLSSAKYVLTNSAKISTVFRPVYQVTCRRVPGNGAF